MVKQIPIGIPISIENSYRNSYRGFAWSRDHATNLNFPP